ncbi:hypothetical protein CDV36_014323 [Fusarium kuroshium]|uniref:HNH nuclease domain-containing protein n=1 Tax=Fusarium kuroshium TaxID=2010991 RepID=A0A3M2RJD3_9HYPO|nr:hypothetical protein CDV36_014323 [Fusarium kuroshium]
MAPQVLTVPIISPSLSLQPRRKPFDHKAELAKLVYFLHPGYPEGNNTLLHLPCLDSGGIHHETARLACAIFANCRWDGYLSSSRDGPAVSAHPDDVLPHGRYYFIIDGEDPYPVVPSFQHFVCPTTLPQPYCEAPIERSPGDDAIRRDDTCRISASSSPNETAHIIPASQSEWWRRNDMSQYTSAPEQLDNTRCAENTVLLRRDLHKLWDDGVFAIVPKQGKWVVHVLLNSPRVEIRERYHNLELQPLAGVRREYLVCRFALAIFSKSHFLNGSLPRKLVFVNADGERPNEQVTRKFSAKEYQKEFPATSARSASRNPSPKRQRPPTADDMLDDRDTTEESDFSQGFGTEDERSEDEEERGRPRKRPWSPESWDGLSLRDHCLDASFNSVEKSQDHCRKRLRPSSPSRVEDAVD